jgi:hypothetical protein
MYRVLKPGGVTLHVAEAFSDNWLCRRARREPEAFQRVWIEEPDHRFVEDADTLVRRFQEAGFKVDWVRAIQGYLPEAGLLAFFLRDQRHLPAWLRCWRWIDGLAGRSDLSREVASLLLTPVAVVNRFAKPSQGLGVIVKARK